MVVSRCAEVATATAISAPMASTQSPDRTRPAIAMPRPPCPDLFVPTAKSRFRDLPGTYRGSTATTSSSAPMRAANESDSALVSETVQLTEL